jgi:hypothetical protein
MTPLPKHGPSSLISVAGDARDRARTAGEIPYHDGSRRERGAEGSAELAPEDQGGPNGHRTIHVLY